MRGYRQPKSAGGGAAAERHGQQPAGEQTAGTGTVDEPPLFAALTRQQISWRRGGRYCAGRAARRSIRFPRWSTTPAREPGAWAAVRSPPSPKRTGRRAGRYRQSRNCRAWPVVLCLWLPLPPEVVIGDGHEGRHSISPPDGGRGKLIDPRQFSFYCRLATGRSRSGHHYARRGALWRYRVRRSERRRPTAADCRPPPRQASIDEFRPPRPCTPAKRRAAGVGAGKASPSIASRCRCPVSWGRAFPAAG